MIGKKIIVIGGSIAGCTTAILLRRLGANVIILERSAGLISKGAGISLPKTIVQQCIELNLFDPNIPHLDITSRSFTHKNDSEEYDQRTFWTQPSATVALNWTTVYQNLRKRIESKYYYTNAEIRRIESRENGHQLETSAGVIYEADLIIAADGVDSTARAHIFPNIHPEYAGYVAWRGTVDQPNLVEQNIFNERAPYYVFPNGHILFYRIPATDHQSTGKTILNWVMYENRQGVPLNDLLIDKRGKQHSRSLPAGSLSDTHIQYLQEFAKRVLPHSIAELVIQTQQPFIQAVFDFQLPAYSNNHIIFVGDAASTLRPHTASGVLKALINGIQLRNLVESRKGEELSNIVCAWKNSQQLLLSEEVQKAKMMGAALVTNPPIWGSMNQEKMDRWWVGVMQEKTWYATSRADRSAFINNSIFCPVTNNAESTLNSTAKNEFK